MICGLFKPLIGGGGNGIVGLLIGDDGVAIVGWSMVTNDGGLLAMKFSPTKNGPKASRIIIS